MNHAIDPDSLPEWAHWLALLETPGVGRETARRLLQAIGTPQAVLQTPTEAICRVLGSASAQAQTIAQGLATAYTRSAELIHRTEHWLQASDRRHICALGDAHYPPALLEIADPPLLVYLEGRIELLGAMSIAVVGSRRATVQGIENARHFSAELSRAGMAVVSGLALGIDAAAHEGALQAVGSTIAVIGTGLDEVYPPRNRALTQQIQAQGLIISEYAIGTPALKEHFPQRNRIIAGLSRGTLVVEASLPSGSLITARLATESGRDVFAIPGSIHAPQSRGCHALIKQGAALVESADDVLEGLAWSPVTQRKKAPSHHQASLPLAMPEHFEPSASVYPTTSAAKPALAAQLSEHQTAFLHLLGHDPQTLDTLTVRSQMATPQLLALLMELEIQGVVECLPGGFYQQCIP
jgi:DNA processing protein